MCTIFGTIRNFRSEAGAEARSPPTTRVRRCDPGTGLLDGPMHRSQTPSASGDHLLLADTLRRRVVNTPWPSANRTASVRRIHSPRAAGRGGHTGLCSSTSRSGRAARAQPFASGRPIASGQARRTSVTGNRRSPIVCRNEPQFNELLRTSVLPSSFLAVPEGLALNAVWRNLLVAACAVTSPSPEGRRTWPACAHERWGKSLVRRSTHTGVRVPRLQRRVHLALRVRPGTIPSEDIGVLESLAPRPAPCPRLHRMSQASPSRAIRRRNAQSSSGAARRTRAGAAAWSIRRIRFEERRVPAVEVREQARRVEASAVHDSFRPVGVAWNGGVQLPVRSRPEIQYTTLRDEARPPQPVAVGPPDRGCSVRSAGSGARQQPAVHELSPEELGLVHARDEPAAGSPRTPDLIPSVGDDRVRAKRLPSAAQAPRRRPPSLLETLVTTS
jgi:hypothetical protein